MADGDGASTAALCECPSDAPPVYVYKFTERVPQNAVPCEPCSAWHGCDTTFWNGEEPIRPKCCLAHGHPRPAATTRGQAWPGLRGLVRAGIRCASLGDGGLIDLTQQPFRPPLDLAITAIARRCLELLSGSRAHLTQLVLCVQAISIVIATKLLDPLCCPSGQDANFRGRRLPVLLSYARDGKERG